MKKIILPILVSILSLGILGLTPDAFAAVIDSVQSGDWSDTATWGGIVPDRSDTARVIAGHTVDVTNAQLVNIVNVRGTLDIRGAGSLTTTGVGADLTVTPTGTVNNYGFVTVTDDLRGGGGIFNNNPSGTLAITNNLQVFGGSTFSNFGTVLADELFVYDEGTTFNNDGAVILASVFWVGKFTAISGPSVFNNNPTGSINGTGTNSEFSVHQGSTITNNGTIHWSSNLPSIGLEFLGTFTNTGTGTMTVTGTADWIVSNESTFSNACGGIMSTASDFIIHKTSADNDGSLTVGGDVVTTDVTSELVNDGVIIIDGMYTGTGKFTNNGNSCDVLEFISEEESTQKIPDWVKNTMQWFLGGKISEDEMINALQFLIKEGIIKI